MMSEITITGHSDDLIEIEGAISEEFNAIDVNFGDERGFAYIAVSDGTLLRAEYDEDGLWRFQWIAKGTAAFQMVFGDVTDDTNDIVTLKGDIQWVIYGSQKAMVKP